MRSRHSPGAARKKGRSHPQVEVLEDRRLLSNLLDPLTQPKFVNPLPNPLADDFIFQPQTQGSVDYEIGVHQFQQSLGLVNPETGAPLETTLWGYGNDAQPPTYPGRTFEVQRDERITVQWTNNLVDSTNNPLPHLVPVDTSLHWAFPKMPEQGDPVYPEDGVPIVTHLHGGHTRSDSDGLPDAWFTPDYVHTGRLFNKVYTYDNDQEAATLWYHDHALGVTRLNVYAGLAGFYIIRDEFDTGVRDDPATPENENPLGLPTGPYEVPLVIQDRMFTDDGQLYYPAEPEVPGSPDPSVLPEFFGDHILVNGQAWPFLEVEPRQYRFRLLNGSDSRVYDLHLTGQPFLQIGTDDALLDNPVAVNRLTIAPGERADVVLDFSRLEGRTIIVKNNAKTPFPGGDAIDPRTVGQIMAFKVTKPLDTSYPLTSVTRATNLRPGHAITPLVQDGATRELILFEGTDKYGRLQPMLGTVGSMEEAPKLNGTQLWDDATTETPALNDVEVWEIYNATEDAHPIHLHLVTFQILSRQKFGATIEPKEHDDGSVGGYVSDIDLLGQPKPPPANEEGWKDTVVVFPGEVARVIAKFDRVGEYVWHCHILSHEDHEMMRRFEVQPPAPAPGALAATLQLNDGGWQDQTSASAGAMASAATFGAGAISSSAVDLVITAREPVLTPSQPNDAARPEDGPTAVLDRSSNQMVDAVGGSPPSLIKPARTANRAVDLVFADFDLPLTSIV